MMMIFMGVTRWKDVGKRRSWQRKFAIENAHSFSQ